jgi:nucleoside-diphosphate-sugar epimerase
LNPKVWETKVRAIYRSTPSLEKTALFTLYKRKLFWNKSEWICADITDVPSLEIAFQNINMVYHCAALISFDPKKKRKKNKY